MREISKKKKHNTKNTADKKEKNKSKQNSYRTKQKNLFNNEHARLKKNFPLSLFLFFLLKKRFFPLSLFLYFLKKKKKKKKSVLELGMSQLLTEALMSSGSCPITNCKQVDL